MVQIFGKLKGGKLPECEMKRRIQMQENLWVRTIGCLNVPIQSAAITEVSESDFGSLSFCLFASCSFVSKKTSGPGCKNSDARD